jgi:UDP-N-acetylmuramoylalanine--D-glutamate ligase
VPCHAADSLEAAVARAHQLARPGETVLFSPGTSSFDMFRSYEERGDFFKQLTRQLQPR